MSEEKRYSLINVKVPLGVMNRIADSLEGILDVLRVVYHAELTPREPLPKVKPGRLFVQTSDNLMQLQEEARRRGEHAEPNYDDRARESPTT